MALRAGARHLVERELRAGGDDEVVIGQPAAVCQFQRIAFGVDARDRLSHEGDVLFLQIGPNLKRDGLAISPTHRHPRVGRHELEVVHRIDQGNAVIAPELFAQFVGGGHAASSSTEYDDV
jgi:hypothetical protein